jgi:uncharacterized phiE125 gp8 family phage protein
MPLILITPPAIEPVSLADVKAHLRLDTNNDDLLLSALIATSRQQIEAALDLALIHQTWSLTLDAWPSSRRIDVPLAPVSALTAVRTFDTDGIASPLPLASFQLDRASTPPRIHCKAALTIATPLRALAAIELTFIAGFGATASAVPAPIRQALLLLVAHWYDNRSAGDASISVQAIPDAVSALLQPYRQHRL